MPEAHWVRRVICYKSTKEFHFTVQPAEMADFRMIQFTVTKTMQRRMRGWLMNIE